MVASVFGPVVNALVALGLFAVMLLVLRSRRPGLRRAGRGPSGAGLAAGGAAERDAQVCGDPATGR